MKLNFRISITIHRDRNYYFEHRNIFFYIFQNIDEEDQFVISCDDIKPTNILVEHQIFGMVKCFMLSDPFILSILLVPLHLIL